MFPEYLTETYEHLFFAVEIAQCANIQSWINFQFQYTFWKFSPMISFYWIDYICISARGFYPRVTTRQNISVLVFAKLPNMLVYFLEIVGKTESNSGGFIHLFNSNTNKAFIN